MAWSAPDSALPCAEGQESVVAVEYNDAAWLYSDTCGVRPGPASPYAFARTGGGVQLVDESGRVLSKIQLGPWLVRGDRDPLGRSIAWSPDGQALLIHEVYNVEERTEDGWPLKILTAEGGSVSVGAAWEAQWTPLGTVAYRGGGRLDGGYGGRVTATELRDRGE